MTAYKPDDQLRSRHPASPRGPLGGASATVVLALLVVAGAAVGLWLWLWADDDSAGPEQGVTIEDVAEDRFSDALVGDRVTISGEVTATLIPGRAFWIGGDGMLGENVLVVTETPNEALDDDTVVQATGVVADFETVDLLTELDDDAFDVGVDIGPYEDQNVLLVEEMTILDSES